MARFVTILLLSALLAGCQSTSQPVPTPTPSPIPTPHTPVASAVLQLGDVATGLSMCPGSGPIASYVSTVGGADPVLAQRLAQQWLMLTREGAYDAAISVFTADPAACAAELGSTSKTMAAASFVAIFADEGQADRAWEAGIFGFVPPVPGEAPPGVQRGTVTGLGLSSWTYERPPVRLACWHRSVFVSLVVLTNYTVALHTEAAIVDARLN